LSHPLHRQIAVAALQEGFLTPQDLCDAMEASAEFELGSSLVAVEKFWVEHGWLKARDFSQLIDQIDTDHLAFDLDDAPTQTHRVDENLATDAFDLDDAPTQTHRVDENLATELVRTVAAQEAADPRRQIVRKDSSDLRVSAGSERVDDVFRRESTKRFHRKDLATTVSDLPTGFSRDNPFAFAETGRHDPSLAAQFGQQEPTERRYDLGDLLGQGGGGRVIRAFDREIGRMVAMKILPRHKSSEPEVEKRFRSEAQITGQLEHPHIIPIYDFGKLPTGEVFYTMQEFRGSSLREVLDSTQPEDNVTDYTLIQLVRILDRVSMAVHYAHHRGVVHQDLKPENIMLGEFDEVVLTDWGMARIIGDDLVVDSYEPPMTVTMGTPAYMSPEQAKGVIELVDHLSDVYSLGAVLYEILALQPPFGGENLVEIMHRVIEEEPAMPSTVAPQRVPKELEHICARAMSKERESRFESAEALHEALAAWLEGMQVLEAASRVEEANAAKSRFQIANRRRDTLSLKVEKLSSQIDTWDPIERKRGLWELQEAQKASAEESDRSFGEAVTGFAQALSVQPDNNEARRSLAELYWNRYLEVEGTRDLESMKYFENIVRQYDDGTWLPMLEAKAALRVTSEPEGAVVHLASYLDEDRRMSPGKKKAIGTTPALIEDLTIGSYEVTFVFGSGEERSAPTFLERDKEAHVHRNKESSRHDFVRIDGGFFVSGGDPDAIGPTNARSVNLAAFFIRAHPVTFRNYLAWLQELEQENHEKARVRRPRTGSNGPLVVLDDGKWNLVDDDDTEFTFTEDMPVVGIGWDDAVAYAAWQADTLGMPIRLPTEFEMEKAGRGLDGRHFSWGNHFDPAFCRMKRSREDKATLEAVGSFAADRSPFGVHDLSGGVREWCNPDSETMQDDRPIKGGAWNQDERCCRLASRVAVNKDIRSLAIGMRLACDPDKE
jgi:eukaryotic-like serine/threonine-protein kinase